MRCDESQGNAWLFTDAVNVETLVILSQSGDNKISVIFKLVFAGPISMSMRTCPKLLASW